MPSYRSFWTLSLQLSRQVCSQGPCSITLWRLKGWGTSVMFRCVDCSVQLGSRFS